MSQTNYAVNPTPLGRVLLKTRGAYGAATAYEPLDIVSYNGDSYVARAATKGNLPTNATYWYKMTDVGGSVTAATAAATAATTAAGTATAAAESANALTASVQGALSDLEAAALRKAAPRFARYASGQAVSVPAAAGSLLRVTASAACTVAHTGDGSAENVTFTAGQTKTLTAQGHDALSASAGTLTVEYSPGSEARAAETNVYDKAAGAVAKVAAGIIPGSALDVTLAVAAEQETRAAGKNRANPDEIVIGGFDAATGAEISNSARMRTGFLLRPDGASVVYSGIPAGVSVLGTYQYDAKKGFVVNSSIMQSSTRYVRYLLRYADGLNAAITAETLTQMRSSFQYEIGSAATAYEPYTPAMPSPEAPSAISGRSAFKVTRSWRNILQKWPAAATTQGITITPNPDGSYTLSGTMTSSSNATWHVETDLPVAPGTRLTISGSSENVRILFAVYERSPSAHVSTLATVSGVGGRTTITVPVIPSTQRFDVYIQVPGLLNRVVNNEIIYPQVEIGDVATSFEPYQGGTYNVTPATQLYGFAGAPDEVDLARGVVTRRTVLYPVTGNEASINISTLVPGTGSICNISNLPGIKNYGANGISANIRCTRYVSKGSEYGTTWSKYNIGDCLVRTDNTGTSTNVGMVADFTTSAAFRAHLQALYAAGTPLQIQYELEKPVTEAIAPVVIPALSGVNIVYMDAAGGVTAGGRITADEAYRRIMDQITALQATVTGGRPYV